MVGRLPLNFTPCQSMGYTVGEWDKESKRPTLEVKSICSERAQIE